MLHSPELATLPITIIPVSPREGVAAPGCLFEASSKMETFVRPRPISACAAAPAYVYGRSWGPTTVRYAPGAKAPPGLVPRYRTLVGVPLVPSWETGYEDWILGTAHRGADPRWLPPGPGRAPCRIVVVKALGVIPPNCAING